MKKLNKFFKENKYGQEPSSSPRGSGTKSVTISIQWSRLKAVTNIMTQYFIQNRNQPSSLSIISLSRFSRSFPHPNGSLSLISLNPPHSINHLSLVSLECFGCPRSAAQLRRAWLLAHSLQLRRRSRPRSPLRCQIVRRRAARSPHSGK